LIAKQWGFFMRSIIAAAAFLAMSSHHAAAQNGAWCNPELMKSEADKKICSELIIEHFEIFESLGKKPSVEMFGDCITRFSKFGGYDGAKLVKTCSEIFKKYPELYKTSTPRSEIPLVSRWYFEGDWGSDEEECKDDEGPNWRTIIDLRENMGGKPAPYFSRYEYHCIIDNMSTFGKEVALGATCYEHLSEYPKDTNEGQKDSFRISPAPDGAITINGRKFIKCKPL